MTGSDATLENVMGPTAVVQLAGAVDAPDGELVHILAPGVSAFDLLRPMEEAA